MGYLGYDVARRIERLPDTCIDDLRILELTMLLVGDLAAMDHHTGDVWLIANAVNYDDSPERLEWAYEDAVSASRRCSPRWPSRSRRSSPNRSMCWRPTW